LHHGAPELLVFALSCEPLWLMSALPNNGAPANPPGAGPQNEVAGVDQVNMKLPRSLAGHRGANLQIAFDGSAVDDVFLYFQ
jgi:uncharacterized protein (TIGR03437 family)